MTSKPSITFAIQCQEIEQEKPFSFSIRRCFAPQDGSLRYKLTAFAPKWIQIDEKRGIISGIAPKVTYDKPYKINVVVSNNLGVVTQSFMTKVLCTEMFSSMSHTLEYTLRKQKYGSRHIHPYTPELLEYLYHYYNQPESQGLFTDSIKHAAAQAEMNPPNKNNYVDFRDFMYQLNPDIENFLRQRLIERLGTENVLLTSTLNNMHLRNLYRQGSAPAGVIPIPVWNHLNAPSLHNRSNWNPIDNVLDSATDAVYELQLQNQQAHRHRPSLQLTPNHWSDDHR